MKWLNLFSFACLMFAILSCNDDKNDSIEAITNGVIISNEGGFGNGDGSISFFDKDSLKIVNDLFLKFNNRSLGDVVQSVSIANNKAFIVVNNSQKIEVINLENFKSITTLTGLSYPRYFLQVDENKGYVSNGNYAGQIYIVDLGNIEVIDSIVVGSGPETMAKSGKYIFVANSGGWDVDSTISVIDANSDKLIKTIEVADIPIDIEIDVNGDIWVLCKGKVLYDFVTFEIIAETASKLVQISATDYSIISEITIGQTGDYYNPTRISISKDKKTLYYTEVDGLHSIDCENPDNSGSLFCSKSFTGLEIDPEEDIIYGFTSPSYTASGYMFRYKNDGELIDSFAVGIGPNGANFFTFK